MLTNCFSMGNADPINIKHTCAPVNVAMSRIVVAFRSFFAYATPSANTKRPSASVLLISTVRPEYNSWISSGLLFVTYLYLVNRRDGR